MKKPIILCVDDEKIVLDSLKKELSVSFKDMLSLEFAESAAEGLEVLEDLIEDGYDIPIIISDWLMPEMKGDEFLIQVHTFLPETRKIMLTGQATTEGVGNAVNKAKLYRYIAKPWEPEDLDLTITEAFKSYYRDKQIEATQRALKELNQNLEVKVKQRTREVEDSKKEIQLLLDKTLKGSVNALLNIISKSNPTVFEKAIKMRDITKRIVLNLSFEPIWEYEISALLSQIGCLDIDKDLVNKFFTGVTISQNELNVFKLHPEKSYEILKKIPHLENASEGILYMFSEEKKGDVLLSHAPQAARISKILRVAHDFDQALINGKSEKEAVELFKRHKNIYDAEVVNSLFEIIHAKEHSSSKSKIKSLSISGLKIGMILAENVKTNDGKVILNSDEEITQGILMNLTQVKKKSGIVEPIYVYNK